MSRTQSHATTNRDVADEDVEQLPFIIESLRETKPRAERKGKDYMALHDRLRHLFGSAKEYPCVDCFGPAREWSLDSYEDAIRDRITNCWYSPDVTRYLPRCNRCHKVHDMKLRDTQVS